MGCCQSAPSTTHRSSNQPVSKTSNTVMNPAHKAAGKEDKIELAFKAKRANVFAENLSSGSKNLDLKKVPKTPNQVKIIRKALSENYIFASLTESDIGLLIESMGIIDISKGEAVITQGGYGDYFYIIERGSFTVSSNGKKVATIGEGKSFGELALIYNSPRQATVTADSSASLYSLDRDTFRYILSQSSAQRQQHIKKALSQVTLLDGLTDEQFDRLCDTVEIVPYTSGDNIIRKGDTGNIFYMIKEGTVKVSDMGAQFSDHTLTAGEYFGERALLTGEPRAANITAVTNCTLLALDRESFNLLLGPLREVLDTNMNMRVLSSIKIFDKLTTEDKTRLIRSFKFEKFSAGSTIITEGEKGQTFYILKEGNVRVVAGGVEVGQLQPGKYFGELSLLDDEVRKASVVAVNDCECFVLDRATFNRIVSSIQNDLKKETTQRLESLKGVGENASTNYKMEDLKTLAVLGSGTFGRVTLVQEKNTKAIFALKTMLKSEIIAHKQQANVINEKNLMKECNHPFILRLYQTFKDSKRLHMLLEFIQGGELFSVLHTATTDGVPDAQGKFYASGVLMALEYMHSKDIAYRDMKPENCLIDSKGYPKIVDFGFAKVIHGKSFTLCGTPEYLAPELVLGRGHNKAVDYWAFGILVYEMQAGYSPFSDPQGMDQVVICKNIVNGRLHFPKNFNADCKELVKGLLTREVQQRLGNLKLGVDGIKSQKWFAGYDFDAMLNKTLPAPWVPPIKSPTDTSLFDNTDIQAPVDDGFVDTGSWDKDF